MERYDSLLCVALSTHYNPPAFLECVVRGDNSPGTDLKSTSRVQRALCQHRFSGFVMRARAPRDRIDARSVTMHTIKEPRDGREVPLGTPHPDLDGGSK